MTKIIFCTDDDPDDREFICGGLHSIDPTVEIVHTENGVRALQKLKLMERSGAVPSLMIIDMNMPLLDGRELVKQIKGIKAFAKVPIAVFSTSKVQPDIDYFQKYGASVFRKPSSR